MGDRLGVSRCSVHFPLEENAAYRTLSVSGPGVTAASFPQLMNFKRGRKQFVITLKLKE